MPYLAPWAAMPMTSWAPRLAEMKANPPNPRGNGPAGEEESSLLCVNRRRMKPMPSTKTKLDHENRIIDRA